MSTTTSVGMRDGVPLTVTREVDDAEIARRKEIAAAKIKERQAERAPAVKKPPP